MELEDEYDERGLLGLAFHPQYAQNGRFFVYYSVPLQPAMPDSFDHANRLVEFRVASGNPNRAGLRSGRGAGRLRSDLQRAGPARQHREGMEGRLRKHGRAGRE